MTQTHNGAPAFAEIAIRLAQTSRAELEALDLNQLGRLRRLLRDTLADVEEALGPRIVEGWRAGMTYVELANASSYGSVTTITKIMRDQGASPGIGARSRERKASQ